MACQDPTAASLEQHVLAAYDELFSNSLHQTQVCQFKLFFGLHKSFMRTAIADACFCCMCIFCHQPLLPGLFDTDVYLLDTEQQVGQEVSHALWNIFEPCQPFAG